MVILHYKALLSHHSVSSSNRSRLADARVWLRHSRHGHCGATYEGQTGDCDGGLRGSWGLPHSIQTTAQAAHFCLKRCRLWCARCNYISVSLAGRDCSWYFACSRLQQVPTVQFVSGNVSAAPQTTRGSNGAPAERRHAADGVRAYLGALYPAARQQLRRLPEALLIAHYGRLELLYPCGLYESAEQSTSAARCGPISSRYDDDAAAAAAAATPPRVPYLPPGAWYRTSHHSGQLDAFMGGDFFRWHRPVERTRGRTTAAALADFESNLGALVGPAPAWTPAVALARYVLDPCGLQQPQRQPQTPPAQRPDAARSGGRPQPRTPRKAVAVLEHAGSSASGGGGGGGTIGGGTIGGCGLRSSRKAAELRALRDGDFVEVTQWGGVLTRGCPPICGLWGLVWAGSGVLMRVARPRVSTNKASAIADMLRELGRRDAARAQALIAAWGLGAEPDAPPPRGWVATRAPKRAAAVWVHTATGERAQGGMRPDSTASYDGCRARERRAGRPDDAVACAVVALLTAHPCGGTAEVAAFAPLLWRWRDFASRANASDVLRAFDSLGAGGGVGGGHGAAADTGAGTSHAGGGLFSLAEGEALLWLFGACGIGPWHTLGNHSFGWDAMLASLACALGHATLVLAASSNDNGLFHPEFVDYDLPPHLGWPLAPSATAAPGDAPTRFVNDVRRCVSPLAWAASSDGAAITDAADEAELRRTVHRHYLATNKFGVPTRLPNWSAGAVHAAGGGGTPSPPSPCHLAFGAAAASPEGDPEACNHYSRRGNGPNESKACWAWCDGTLSQAKAASSLLSLRIA